jgi:hypothetical protein
MTPEKDGEGLVQATAASAANDGSVIEPVCQWRPIETAPHETTVLLFSPPVDNLYGAKIETGFASQGQRWPMPSGGIRSTMSWHSTATHWMPLPPPPSSDDRTNDGVALDGSLKQTLSEKDSRNG